MNRADFLRWIRESDDPEARAWRDKGFGENSPLEQSARGSLDSSADYARWKRRRERLKVDPAYDGRRTPEFRARAADLMRERRNTPEFQDRLTSARSRAHPRLFGPPSVRWRCETCGWFSRAMLRANRRKELTDHLRETGHAGAWRPKTPKGGAVCFTPTAEPSRVDDASTTPVPGETPGGDRRTGR